MADLPQAILDRAVRLARDERAADSPDGAERFSTRRGTLLDRYGYASRIREEESRAVLVCYPQEWLEGGTIVPGTIDDLSRAIEIPLSGPGDPDDWDALAEENARIAVAVEAKYGSDHGANVAAFATFMSNHRARSIATATPEDIEEFLEEYYIRNVWPSEDARAVVEASLAYAQDIADQQKQNQT